MPVIERELRAEARNTFTYWLRVVGAVTLLIVFVLTVADQRMSAPQLGAALFASLNLALLAAIGLLVPLLTADCISRERREGTLGLLFLTPLTPAGIVGGKIFTQGLRATTILLSALPILALPLVLGGVNRWQIVTAVLFDASSVCLALLAGLLASCWSKDGIRAMFAAEFISAALFFLMGGLLLEFTRWQVGLNAYQNALSFNSMTQYTYGSYYAPDWNMGSWIAGILGEFIGKGALAVSVAQGWVRVALNAFGVALVLLMTGLFFSAIRVRRLWRDEPPSVQRQRVERLLFAPRFGKIFLRDRMKRALNRNPIGWLEQRSSTARVTKWGWCLFTIAAETQVLAGAGWHNLMALQYGLAALLLAGLAFSAAGSFRREQQNGALELILVTPLRTGQIIWGRLRGLWAQFLPGVLAVAGVVIVFRQSHVMDYLSASLVQETDQALVIPLMMASAFLTLPAIGLFFSLTLKRLLSAWTLALLTGLLVPELVARSLAAFVAACLPGGFDVPAGPHQYQEGLGMPDAMVRCATQVVLAAAALFLLQRNIRRRTFALAP